MKLQVENSYLIDSRNVNFNRIWEVNNINSLNNITHMKFRLNADFTRNKSKKTMIDFMERLGSIGLAKRILILNQEGLIQ